MPNIAEKSVYNVRRAAVEAMKATNPVNIMFGTVTKKDPLEINVEQKMILTSAQLVLTSLVQDFDYEMTVDHTTETAGEHPHNHAYTGRKKFTAHFALDVGEKVILLRAQGGQKFIVLDRLR